MNYAQDNESVYWLLIRVMFQAKHQFHDIAERHGLNIMQLNALCMLQEDKPLSMRVLSNTFLCDASSVTGLVDRLESHGLVSRKDHPTDRRIKLITLTQNGILLRRVVLAEIIEAEATRLSPVLSEGERKSLHHMLSKMLSFQLKTK